MNKEKLEAIIASCDQQLLLEGYTKDEIATMQVYMAATLVNLLVNGAPLADLHFIRSLEMVSSALKLMATENSK